MIENSHVLSTESGDSFEIQLGPPASIDSFFVFSLHKSGSVLLNKMIEQACRQCAIPMFSPDQEEFRHGCLIGSLDKSVCRLFVPRGFCYAGFRSWPRYLNNFELNRYKKILLIRDPRDMVVSHYFSHKLSHPIPPGELGRRLREMRSSLAAKSIDEYALESAPQIKRKFEEYQQAIFDDNLRLFRYSDVVFRKREWLTEMLEFVGIDLEPRRVQAIADAEDIRPEVEDPGQHIRQVTPGDHRQKLKPQTILELNRIFAEQLTMFGYLEDDSSVPVAA